MRGVEVHHPADRPPMLDATPAGPAGANSFLAQQLALLPRLMGDPDSALVRVAQQLLPPPRPVWLIRRPASRADPHLRAVADFVVALFERDGALLAGRGG